MSEGMVERLAATAGHRLFEPGSAYEMIVEDNLHRLISMNDDIHAAQVENASIKGVGNTLITGYRCSLRKMCGIEIVGDNNLIFVGAETDINQLDIKITGSECSIYIGAFTTAGGLAIRMFGNGAQYVVGDHCMLAGRVRLGQGVTPVYARSTKDLIPTKDILIGDHVWLAREVSVLPGTTIGMDSIVGQLSQVRGKFPEACVLGGQPAKVLCDDSTWGRKMDSTVSEMLTSSHYIQKRIKPLARLRARIDQFAGPAARADS